LNRQEILVSIPYFRRLAPEGIELLGSLARVLELDSGKRLFREGETRNDLYLVESGEVRIFRDHLHFGQHTLSFLGPGAHFGALSLFHRDAHVSNAETSKPSRLHIIGRDDFERTLLGHPALLRAILEGVVLSLRAANKEVRDVASRLHSRSRPLALPPGRPHGSA
jgi:CRP-like cAMP-binding protein